MTALDVDPDKLVAYADALKDLAEALRRVGTLAQAIGGTLAQLSASAPRFMKTSYDDEWGILDATRPGEWAPFGAGTEAEQEVDEALSDLATGERSSLFFEPTP